MEQFTKCPRHSGEQSLGKSLKLISLLTMYIQLKLILNK